MDNYSFKKVAITTNDYNEASCDIAQPLAMSSYECSIDINHVFTLVRDLIRSYCGMESGPKDAVDNQMKCVLYLRNSFMDMYRSDVALPHYMPLDNALMEKDDSRQPYQWLHMVEYCDMKVYR